jgi:hypothetical protein
LKKHFVTFASSDLERSLLRIKLQAIESGAFDHIHCFTEHMLTPEFYQHFARHLRLGTRGFGYWCWKPQILLQTIQKAEEGDLILYCDAGCEINAGGNDTLEAYFNDADKSDDGFAVFQLEASHSDPDQFIEERWTKEDLFVHFGVSPSDPIRTSNQIIGGVFLFRVGKKTSELIGEWLETYYTSFDLATDKPSKIKNLGKFNEHRHDQSIFSLLIKRRKVKIRSVSEIESSESDRFNTEKVQPIVAARNKQFSFLSRKKKQFWKFTRKVRRVFS